VIAGYEVLGELGRGGMGVVYRARHVNLNRVVALKMILSGTHAGPQALLRFQREAEAVARLQHPNIVQVFDVGEHEGRPYLALEHADGGSLAQQLAGTPQPVRPAAQLVQTLARAIHVAHEKGIIHRDLKPANILLQRMAATSTTRHKKGEEGQAEQGGEVGLPAGSAPGPCGVCSGFSWPFLPKITDFGLAKLWQDPDGQTASGDVVGTPSYMAPEQAAGQTGAIGPAADVWALGAILYELLTGRPPFRGASALDTLQQVRAQEPVPPSRLQPGLPRDLEAICLKCLEKGPQQRYLSAEALAEDLRRFLAGEPTRARPVGAWGRGMKWLKRHPAPAALAAVSGLAALALVGVAVGLAYNTRLQDALEEATTQRAEAERQRLAAERASAEADRLRGQAEEMERRVRYARDMHVAHQAWQDGQVGRVLELLDAWRRPPGDPSDLRGCEWDYLRGLCFRDLRTLRWHTAAVKALAFSADGRRLASADAGGGVRLWDLAGAKGSRPLRGHTAAVHALAFSPDGTRLAAADNEKVVKVWDANTGQLVHTLKGHTGPVYSVAFSPEGKLLIAAGSSAVRFWDADSGKEIRTATLRPERPWGRAG
jgi:hypothetical protein